MKTRILMLLSLAVLIAPVAAAQVTISSTCPADAPILLQPSPLQQTGQYQVVSITNKGNEPITGVVLSWRVTDSAGTVYPGTSAVDFAVSGTPLGPGETSKSEYDAAVNQGQSIRKIEVNCFGVLLSGGKMWGDAKALPVERLLAMRRGVILERQRLLRIYKSEGTTRLIEELNKPVVK